MKRTRSLPHSFEGQIAAEKTRLEEQIATLPHGPEKERLRQKIRQLDTASHLSEWLHSPGLRSPD
jgi:hypothetical protein